MTITPTPPYLDPPRRRIARQSAAVEALPTYVFAELDRLKRDARAQGGGRELIDLGIGSPDRPIPAPVIEVLQRAAADPSTHGYPQFRGLPSFLDSVTRYMSDRFGVRVDRDSETIALAGSKEGIAQLMSSCLDIGDVVLVPEIYYPVYARSAMMEGATVHWLPMSAHTNFLAQLDEVPSRMLRRAKMMVVNYPNNPTGATATREYFAQCVEFARRHGILLVSDMAYAELGFDGIAPPSALEIEGAHDVTVEFHSCSKSFNMAGMRVGFAVGNPMAIEALATIRTNVGYGAPTLVQHGARYALDHYKELAGPVAAGYQARRDAAVEAFRAIGWPVTVPKAAMYLWLRVPVEVGEWEFVRGLLDDVGAVVTPGVAFGPGGQGYFRVSLVAEPDVLRKAIALIGEVCDQRGWFFP